MFGNQASVRSYLHSLKKKELSFHPFVLSHSLFLGCYDINFVTCRLRKEVQWTSGRWWWLPILAATLPSVFLRHARFVVFIRRIFPYFYVHGWFPHGWRSRWWKKRDIGSLSTLSALWDSFSNFAQVNFSIGCTNRDDVSAQFVKASVNVEDLIHFPMLPSNILSNVPRWFISLITVSTK